MHTYGIRATLKLCTQKYEQLIHNGRTDILERLADHELAFHMTDHSVHPIPSEYLDRMGFAEGAYAFERREGTGFTRLKELTGQNLTSYGHPGVAWAPQVFPVLKKWGVPTYLDVHDILRVHGQPFWFGGVLCYTKLNNLAHLDKEQMACSLIASVEEMDSSGSQEIVFLSMYDHPHELVCTQFWDSVNFAYGKNPPYLQPAPLRASGELERLLHQYQAFFDYMKDHPELEFVTAQQAMGYEQHRFAPVTAEDIRTAAAELKYEAGFYQIQGEWCSASELLNLMARQLTGRALLPELVYGPERDEASVVSSPVSAKALAEAVFSDTRRIFGYKQMQSLYRVGDNFINPTDAFATLSKAICEELSVLDVQTGRLAAADYVDRSVQFDGGWDLWRPGFQGKGILEQTILQTWTLKPAIF